MVLLVYYLMKRPHTLGMELTNFDILQTSFCLDGMKVIPAYGCSFSSTSFGPTDQGLTLLCGNRFFAESICF